MAGFFSHLNYSFGNEDWKTEEEALDIRPQDEVLCITASGDRPLNLLTRPCKRMVCVDANPVQNYLLELKIAAMKQLDYTDYLAFLGAAASKNRIETLQQISRSLSPKAARFWSKHEKMINKGVLYQGAVEQLTSLVAKLFAMTRGSKVKRLFAIDDLEEQKKFVSQEWDSYIWRKIFKLVLNPIISRFLIKDPGLNGHIAPDIKPGSYIYDRIHASLERELAKKSPLLSLILKGRVSEEAFSPYLTEMGMELIKPRVSCVEVQTASISKYLESLSDRKFNCFSFSDIASYMSYPDFVNLLNLILKTAKPGARFCLRQFLSSYEIPNQLQPYFMRDKALEQSLEKQDNCFVYRFMVGTIPHPAKKKHK